MMIIETCPKCGHDLVDKVICTNPPISKKECVNCGWTWEGKREGIVRVPFVENTIDTVKLEQSACDNCSNNIKNGGSGICHCILGQQTFY